MILSLTFFTALLLKLFTDIEDKVQLLTSDKDTARETAVGIMGFNSRFTLSMLMLVLSFVFVLLAVHPVSKAASDAGFPSRADRFGGES